jgi:radical SAM protein, TIGR01212 family
LKNQRINMIGPYLQNKFGGKTVKLALDGGFTCPNRDGSKGTGGCIFCSGEGSGELASDIPSQITLLSKKWPSADKYIAYFQSHTNTYAPVSVLREKFYGALEYPGVVGLAAATRPDCLNDDVLDLLSELNKKTFLWVELGLQSIFDDTARLINRCCPLSVYDNAVLKLNQRGIRIVTHLILGLPGETKYDMERSVRYVTTPNNELSALRGKGSLLSEPPVFGLKLHLMNVVKDTRLAEMFPGYEPFGSIEEYVGLVCDLLEIIPYDVTIHRLTGDVPRSLLLTPEWSYRKRTILNGIAHEMAARDTVQGCALGQ